MDFLSGNEERSSRDSSDNRYSALHVHSFFNHNFNGCRHDQVRARTKLYHPKALATFYPLTFPLPTNDPARENSRDLGAPDGQPGPPDCERILLVQQARLLVGGHEKLPAFVGDFGDFTPNRRTVHMYVERRKKDADQRL